MPLQPGQLLNNRYQIIGLLGQGGFGAVYQARDQRLGSIIALKENLGGNPQQFQQEAMFLANLHHPNLPRVTDHFVEPSGAQYLIMDFIEGVDLDTRLQQRGKLDEADALHWISQILGAVAYLHSMGVIHRDIKPANIKITPNNQAVLVDFGIAKVYQPGMRTLTGAKAVSPGYAAPEQYRGGTDQRSDVYSIGATLYALLVGGDPPDAIARERGIAALTAPRALNPSVTLQTETCILRAMEVYPQNRFASAVQMKQALNARPAISRTMPAMQPRAAHTAAMPATTGGHRGLSGSAKALMFGVAALISLMAIGLVISLVFGFISNAFAPTTKKTAAPPTMLPISVQSQRRGNDNAEMVLVPAGEFTMGSNDGLDDETPMHTVYQEALWIDKYEVTNVLYKKCVSAGKCQIPAEQKSASRDPYYSESRYDEFPVIYVSWNDANVYCAWAGKRLPTEAEWEKAARGTERRIFPWGIEFDGTRANSWDSNPRQGDTTAVGSYSGGASPYGVLDIAGNVWEWVSDWYGQNYYIDSPRNNPKGPVSGQYRALRGGAWLNSKENLRAAFRSSSAPSDRSGYIGFRCAE